MGRVAIRRVQYFGDRYEFDSGPIPDGLVVIEGTNGSGKTTFSELIYFGLGGTVKQFQQKGTEQHREVLSDSRNGVRLTLDIDRKQFSVLRHFHAPEDILVSSADEPDATAMPVNRHGSRRIFSDWLLERLGIRVVTLTTGTYKGKLNFLDLMRLIYHDQEPNPSKIFKRPDRDNNFVADSRDFRKAVFEILIGRASDEYYEVLGELKLAETALSDKKASLTAYSSALDRTGMRRQGTNTVFIAHEIQDHEAKIRRLQAMRSDLRLNAPAAPAGTDEMLVLRNQLIANETQVAGFQRKASDTREERVRLSFLEGQLVDDVLRIQKIIHAHDNLQLFQPDTCPCCLRKVDRSPNTCICGQPIEESAYERVFYSSEEYLSILKARRKNIETVRAAIASCDDELLALDALVGRKEAAAAQLVRQLHDWAGTNGLYTTQLERVDEDLAEARIRLERLRSALELEQELERVLQEVDEATRLVQTLQSRAAALEAAAQEQRDAQVAAFDKTYSRLLRETLSDVRTARLGPSYEPVINEGEYREASSGVNRRLMYYLALLEMSLSDAAMPFPRFLLVDTPETAGIDAENLSKAIGMIDTVLERGRLPGQVILTTGPDRYPRNLVARRILTLGDTSRLLRRKT